ncbi:hypothetical protein SAMN06297251_10285 [Fulvimarina manganoxydans]|uniref:Uncharacterized protein n=1 Tax=Fulvimarina manganoxydans TaxID=937218 RepID=A0A1W1YZK8_9HYPH|nr:hypothetical protein SAMN06297251_10285 [Fulvimarina manganoxydans]
MGARSSTPSNWMFGVMFILQCIAHFRPVIMTAGRRDELLGYEDYCKRKIADMEAEAAARDDTIIVRRTSSRTEGSAHD